MLNSEQNSNQKTSLRKTIYWIPEAIYLQNSIQYDIKTSRKDTDLMTVNCFVK